MAKDPKRPSKPGRKQPQKPSRKSATDRITGTDPKITTGIDPKLPTKPDPNFPTKPTRPDPNRPVEPTKPDRFKPTRVRFPPRQDEPKPEPDPVAEGPSKKPPKPGKWSKELARAVAKIKESQKDRPGIEDDCGRETSRVPRPRPFLDCTSNFGPQILAQERGQPATLSFTVWNDGNFAAWSCYVEVYEGPGGYSHPLSDYALRGRRIITLHPGERRDVVLPWVREGTTGRVVGVVSDPILDPKDFAVVEQHNRHITSIHFTNLE
jgi:hypothetical protein